MAADREGSVVTAHCGDPSGSKRFHSAIVDDSFTATAILHGRRRRRTRDSESTIRSQISSRMGVNASDNHAVTHDDLLRLAPGRYRPNR